MRKKDSFLTTVTESIDHHHHHDVVLYEVMFVFRDEDIRLDPITFCYSIKRFACFSHQRTKKPIDSFEVDWTNGCWIKDNLEKCRDHLDGQHWKFRWLLRLTSFGDHDEQDFLSTWKWFDQTLLYSIGDLCSNPKCSMLKSSTEMILNFLIGHCWPQNCHSESVLVSPSKEWQHTSIGIEKK